MQEKTRDFGHVLSEQFNGLPTTNRQRQNLRTLEEFGVIEAQQYLLNSGFLGNKVQFGFSKNFRESLIIENPKSGDEKITSILLKKGAVFVDKVIVNDKTKLTQIVIDSVQQKRTRLW